ncbi:crotonase/enoyl-CoA hydratase family protein [Pseudomaricurvus alkylphenolicus]|uniref:crotonase/enoyl-CoA hydratase family protein n=1 Tax=Pseudomaricurvus alkylphenolicus TaxID=1306991 RepID=UPI001424A250|nr:crotonase/enoyl-CoA hydratase family protein [Pseudomaricurvus alkylphenolicus]NIB42322.1 crotonase/enoyl-CoA hydratase family protein [Pseudomaricurvus alkylphenolicus]
MKVLVEKSGDITTIIINRPEVRNALDRETTELLARAFREFDADPQAKVAILTGAEGQFSSGADLKAWSKGETLRLEEQGDSPIGPVRMKLSKPVIAAVAGYAVAGGMALSLWCDLRVVEETAIFGMLDRRFGVPMIGAVTVNLPRLIGLSHASDLILTGRQVEADEALRMGLANRVVPQGEGLKAAHELAQELASYPWLCLVNDRKAMLEGPDMSEAQAHVNEMRLGLQTINSGESVSGASNFAAGAGRHGQET